MQVFVKTISLAVVFLLMGALSAGAAPGYDELGRLLNPEETFYQNNPSYKGKSIPAVDNYNHLGYTPLIEAIDYGDITAVESLLKQKANPNVLSAGGRTPLEAAASGDKLEIAVLLIKHGADASKGTPYAFAKSDAMRSLLKENGALEAKKPKKIKHIMLDTYAEMEAMQAALAEYEETGNINSIPVAIVMDEPREEIAAMLAKGFNINEEHKGLSTPLVRAINQGWDVEGIRFLLDAGADPSLVDSDGHYPLRRAVFEDNEEIVALLLDAGASVEKPKSGEVLPSPLNWAVYKNGKITKLLLKAGANPNGFGTENEVPLISAMTGHDFEAVELLLDAGADPNLATDRQTPLLAALSNLDGEQKLEVVKLLLKKGADPNKALGDEIPFLAAAGRGGGENRVELVKMLAKAGANVNVTDENGRNALGSFYWSDQENAELAQTLLELGVSARGQEAHAGSGSTLLHLAIEADNMKLLELALKNGASVRVGGANGTMPLLFAAMAGKPKFVKKLLDAGAPVDYIYWGLAENDPNQQLILAEVIVSGNADPDVLKALIKAGAKLNVKESSRGYTALHMAVAVNKPDLVSILIDSGADVSLTSEDGETALHMAKKAAEQHEENKDIQKIVKMLEKAGRK